MNVLIDKRRCVLTDFGSVRNYLVQQKNIVVSGTPEYMPPELWKRKSDVFPSTDIYEIGIWLYQMLNWLSPTNRAKKRADRTIY